MNTAGRRMHVSAIMTNLKKVNTVFRNWAQKFRMFFHWSPKSCEIKTDKILSTQNFYEKNLYYCNLNF